MRTFFKVTITLISLLGLLLGVALIVVSVLDIAQLMPIGTDEVRVYGYAFYDRDILVYSAEYKRGEKVDFSEVPDGYDSVEPDGTIYVYKGWDWTGDGVVDIAFPTAAYVSFTAQTVYEITPPYVEPESSEPEPEESSSTTGDSSSSGNWWDWIFGGNGK